MDQARRLLDGSGYIDGLFLLIALRQMIRAAEMAQQSLRNRQAKQILSSALRRFRADLPELVNARDIIEHFDEYAVGEGKLQEAELAADPGLTRAELAKRYALRMECATSYPVVRVGERSIDVTKVLPAVQRLYERMNAAADVEDGR